MPPPHVLVLIAGTNEPSNSDYLAENFIEGMREIPGISFTKLHVKDLSLHHFTLADYEENAHEEQDFQHIKELFRNIKGLVIATPVWNFSVPAHLKNFIDRLGAIGLKDHHTHAAFPGIPFYLIFTGGAPAPAWTGLLRGTTSALPRALQYFGAHHCGTHFEPRCTKGRGVFGLVVHERPESLHTVRSEGEKFARLVGEYARTGKLSLKRSLTHHASRMMRYMVERFF